MKLIIQLANSLNTAVILKNIRRQTAIYYVKYKMLSDYLGFNDKVGNLSMYDQNYVTAEIQQYTCFIWVKETSHVE